MMAKLDSVSGSLCSLNFVNACSIPQENMFLQMQFNAYFQNPKEAILSIPLLLNGTSFQKLVWQQIQKIPVGETLSYQQIARAINYPTAVRAVASAIGANPVLILVPCHRVILANGDIGGYSAGQNRKVWLLEKEQT